MSSTSSAKADVVCPVCGGPTKVIDDVQVWGWQAPGGKLLACYQFPLCDTYGKLPDGPLAGRTLRHARFTAREDFDKLWRAKMRRDKVGRAIARPLAVAWLAKELGIAEALVDFSMFDEARCWRVIELCRPYLEKLDNVQNSKR